MFIGYPLFFLALEEVRRPQLLPCGTQGSKKLVCSDEKVLRQVWPGWKERTGHEQYKNL